jgi:hypothetical protein
MYKPQQQQLLHLYTVSVCLSVCVCMWARRCGTAHPGRHVFSFSFFKEKQNPIAYSLDNNSGILWFLLFLFSLVQMNVMQEFAYSVVMVTVVMHTNHQR